MSFPLDLLFKKLTYIANSQIFFTRESPVLRGRFVIGRVEKYLLKKIEKEGTIHITLIDPEKVTSSSASRIAYESECCQTTAIMIGGSTIVSTSHLNMIVKARRELILVIVMNSTGRSHICFNAIISVILI